MLAAVTQAPVNARFGELAERPAEHVSAADTARAREVVCLHRHNWVGGRVEADGRGHSEVAHEEHLHPVISTDSRCSWWHSRAMIGPKVAVGDRPLRSVDLYRRIP